MLQIARRLGERIRAARVRRRWRQEDLAGRTGLSRSFVQAVERGAPSCALGGVLTLLWTLGLANEVELIADPGLDRDGLALALAADTKRVFVPRRLDNDF
ncbi:MAG: helix-turn-helix domain-containing protein [Sulfuritalea sp.]|nr:helix-turn-helix domain-containing protein [Sulfuritalea sp.]